MIINKVSNIIEAIISEERRKIDTFTYKIPHTSTIGDQFEGTTIKFLEKSLPQELNLKVTSGFIVNEVGEMSGQIDCMISKNEGHLIPGTLNDYFYEIKDILAVIEVKKNLFKKDLIDAYFHLNKVKDLKQTFTNLSTRETGIILKTFAKATGRMLETYNEIDLIDDFNLESIFHGLVGNFQHPLRIIIGYDGFKTEANLRNKFYDFLTESTNKKGFGPFSYPDLIICENSCLLKLNGEPYNPFVHDNYYNFYASCENNNIKILTELLISRIDRFYPFDFTDDDNIEPIKPFLAARINSGKLGWDILAYDNAIKTANEWKPVEISKDAAKIILQLCDNPRLKINEILVFENGGIIDELLKTKFVAKNKDEIFLISDQLKLVKTIENKFLIAEDKFGYFTNWLNKNSIINNHNIF